MKMESAARSGAEIAGEALNKLGKYSYSNIKKNKETITSEVNSRKPVNCYNCGNRVSEPILKHKEQCPAKNVKCHKCGKLNHFAKVCRSPKDIRHVEDITKEQQDDDTNNDGDLYNINLFRIKTTRSTVKPRFISQRNVKDFKVQVLINNNLDTVVADTGARISVCGTAQARKWGMLNKLVPSNVKIKPYNSPPIPVYGEVRCAVTFGSTSVPVKWHIISGSCEPILAGHIALQLGIIQFNSQPNAFQPILMIDSEDKKDLQDCLIKYPRNFTGLGRLKNHQVKLHVDQEIKPVNVPPRSMPYHLKERAQRAIDEMIQQDVIEEHPRDEPAPWIANAVLAPKPDGSIRVTLDARNVNKGIKSTNLPIPRHEDIKAKLNGCKVFSKMDFKSAFWQIELEPSSRYLTVFHANDKLYRYKRLTMGIKPAQGELNIALRPIFAHIPKAHQIHDDLIVATETEEEMLR